MSVSLTEKVLPLEVAKPAISDRAIGAILVDEGKLRQEDAEKILALQKEEELRFGEAALKLGLVSMADLRHALAKQYDFSYLLPTQEQLSNELIAAYDPFGRASEELRALRTQLLLHWFSVEAGRKMLAITSPGPGEGRSYLAANLAVAFSQLGARTLLIDADLRHSRQHQLFNLSNRKGLSSILSGRGDYSAIASIPQLSSLSVLTAGAAPPNPQELLTRTKFSLLLKEMQVRFDVLILDGPPSTAYADFQTIGTQTGGALVLARRHYTRIREIRELVQGLSNAGIRVVGTVMTAF